MCFKRQIAVNKKMAGLYICLGFHGFEILPKVEIFDKMGCEGLA